MKMIPVSDPTYRRLLRLANSFDDEPEDVILRLLDESEGSSTPPVEESATRRASPGSILPVEDYWVPLLQVLREADGEAPSNDVIDALEDRMRNVLSDRDRERLKSGEIRWRNRARFARLRMKERGLISDTSRRGIWAITTRGRAYLRMREEQGS